MDRPNDRCPALRLPDVGDDNQPGPLTLSGDGLGRNPGLITRAALDDDPPLWKLCLTTKSELASRGNASASSRTGVMIA